MNVDSQFPTTPLAAYPARPVKSTSEQASARPVDRPHHSEPSDNQRKGDQVPADARKEAGQPRAENKTVRQDSELNQQEKREVEQLQARDREVRAHEAAHKNAAGGLARGNAQFDYESGPDGKRYAVGGEVSIDTARVDGDPQATIEKARTIRRAATAPADPSAQDFAVAAKATRMEAEARRELTETDSTEHNNASSAESSAAPRTGFSSNPTRPAPIGDLLDVIA